MTNTIISENYLSEAIQTVKEMFERNNIDVPFDRISAIKWNGRIKKKEGYCCYSHVTNMFEINISKVLLNISKEEILGTLAHEIIHTVEGCFNHGSKFLCIMDILNKNENIKITVTGSKHETINALESVGKLSSMYKYEAYCTKCGKHIKYISKGNANIVKHPEYYYHKECGGSLAIRRIGE